jgi:hypothetical protein
MKHIVFYSWQSDLPNACNRGFIQEALENAASAIRADDSIAVEPVVDRDTQGVPGAPDIASTILVKITAADVFVADVSIVIRNENRAMPNPNVLIELGYALKALGHERVVLVFNTAFGKIEELPFDLRLRRVLTYEMPAGGIPRGPERKLLQKQLDAAIRAALDHATPAGPAPIPAVSAVENQQPNRIIVLRRNLDALLRQLADYQPKRYSEGGTVDDLQTALNMTQEAVAEFTKITDTVSVMNDADAAVEMLRWFGRVFERYDKPEGFVGPHSNADEDYFKFLGHELFVTFVATLLREQRWRLLDRVLSEPIPVRYLSREQEAGSVDWRYASEHLPSVLDESPRRQRLSLHADMLNERHTTGGLAAVMPMDDFVAADYFLFLLGEMSSDQWSQTRVDWRAWSTLYLKRTPLFLRNAESKQVAEEILKVFKIPDAEEFRLRFRECAPHLRMLFRGGPWRDPVRLGDIDYFGTR